MSAIGLRVRPRLNFLRARDDNRGRSSTGFMVSSASRSTPRKENFLKVLRFPVTGAGVMMDRSRSQRMAMTDCEIKLTMVLRSGLGFNTKINEGLYERTRLSPECVEIRLQRVEEGDRGKIGL